MKQDTERTAARRHGPRPRRAEPVRRAPGLLDRLNLRKPAERAVYGASRAGFRAVGAANRTFTAARARSKPERPAIGRAERDLFDLTPSDEQKMIVEATAEFAPEQLRPAAAAADDACVAPPQILERAVTELGITQLAVPESLGGMGGERSATTGVLVNEALAHGDMGLAVACLAPAAVSTALTLWGDESSRPPTCLPSSATVRGPPPVRAGASRPPR